MDDIFRGELVRLSGDDPQTVAEAFSRWNRDSEYADCWTTSLLSCTRSRIQSMA